MNRWRLSAPALAIGAAVLASGLTGCSADQTSSESPSLSRMVRPSEIPDVAVSSSDDAFNASGSGTTTQYIVVPQQIWVRSTSYGQRTDTLTLATASNGTFDVYDARPVGGSAQHHDGASCTKTSEKPLDARPHGAISAVSHLVTLSCPDAAPMAMPVIEGQWGDMSKGGTAQAIFALGGSDKQGQPDLPSAGTETTEAKIDTTVVSVKHAGSTLTARVWATEFVDLSLEKAEVNSSGTDEPVDCTTKTLPGTKPGVRTGTVQRLFEITCTKVPSTTGYALFSTAIFGQVGKTPSMVGSEVELKPGAQAAI